MEKAVKSGVNDPWDTEIYNYATEIFSQNFNSYRKKENIVWSFVEIDKKS